MFDMKKKAKKYDPVKIQKEASRNAEIKAHGKQVSFRSGSIFKSAKEYKRIKLKKEDIDED